MAGKNDELVSQVQPTNLAEQLIQEPIFFGPTPQPTAQPTAYPIAYPTARPRAVIQPINVEPLVNGRENRGR